VSQPNVKEFAVAAEEFVTLAEREGKLMEVDLWKVRDILLKLIYHVTAADNAGHGTEFDGDRPDDDAFARAVKRFSTFPFNFYRVVFDPHDMESPDEPVTGMLADDLADIYRDLAEGLDNYRKGHVAEACFDWSQSYRSHWARHAVSALSAIEIYRTDNYKDVEPNASPNGGPAEPPDNSSGGPPSAIVRRHSMSYAEALALIHAEAGESGLVVDARMGRDLDPARIARLVSAVRTATDGLRGADSLDRELAASLHILGFEVLRQAESWASRSQKLPKPVLDSLLDLQSAVEDLFFDISR
jgi:hypothetical protein